MADRSVSVRLQANIAQYQAAMAKASASTRELATATGKMAADGDKNFQTLSRGAGVAGIAVAAGFTKMVSTAASFDKQMSAVAAVAGASADQLKQLRDAAIEAGAATSFSASEAAKAQEELVKAGISVQDILGGGLAGALDLAAAGSLDLAQAAEIAAQSMNIFGLGGSDVTHIADLLAAGANKSAADVAQLGDAMRQGGLVAAQTGLSIEETVGALSAFADNALIGSDAGTSLKTMLQRLTPQSAEAAGMFEELGFTAYDAQGNFIGLEGLAGELQDSLGGLSTEQRNSAMATMFGSDAVRAANILYSEGAEGIADYVAAVDDQGAAAEMAAAKLDNLHGDLEALGGSIETVLIKNGSGATSVLRGLAQGATGAVNAFGEMPAPIQAGVVGLTGLAGVAGLAVGAIGVMAPKVREAQAALDKMGTAGQWTSRHMGSFARGVGAASLALTAMTVAGQVLNATMYSLDTANLSKLENSLLNLAENGRLGGEAADLLGEGMDDLGRAVEKVADPSVATQLQHVGNEVTTLFGVLGRGNAGPDQALQTIDDLDKALASLASVDADAAAEALGQIKEALGPETFEALLPLLDDYEGTLASLDTAARTAAGGMEESTEATAEHTEKMLEDEEAAKALEERYQSLGDAFGEFTSAQTAWDSVVEATRGWAEATAESTESAEDSWEDYYDGFSVSTDKWIEEMQRQVDAQMEWKENIVSIAAQGRGDVAAILADMGPEGAELAQRFTELTGAEFQTAADLFVRTMGDGGAAAGEALQYELAVMAEIGRTGGNATAQAIVDAVGGSVDDVAQIAAHYGVALAGGLNPVLQGVGKPLINIGASVKSLVGRLGFAQGGQVPGTGDRDSVPAMLTPGEFVVRKNAVRAIGLDKLYRLNHADRNPVRFYAQGGFVAPGDVPAPPNVSGYGTGVGFTAAQAMDHLFSAVKQYIGENAIPSASGSATGLDPAFLGMFNRYNQALGGILRIVSGFRSRAQQSRLYASYLAGTGNLAAPPGRSRHEQGLAIDHAPNSNAAMRSTARGFGLHYPVRGEPWHVEPVHVRDKGGPLMPGLTWNGTGGPEMVLPVSPQRFASGGLVADAAASTQARIGAEGAGRHHARFLYAADDLDQIGRAYADVVQQIGEAEAWALLQVGLTADGYVDAARRMIDAAGERADAEAELVKTARKVEDIRHEIGELGTEQYLAILQERLAGEKRYSDEWLSIWNKIDSIESDLVDARKERLDDLLDQQAAIHAKIEQGTAKHHANLRDLERDLAADQAAAMRDRADALASWASIEERSVIRWGNTVGALTRNVRDQIGQFAEWQDTLGLARGRGVSEAVIDMLGLDEGPQALGQLRLFMSASEEEIAALNAAVGERQSQASERARQESTQAYSELGRQLADMQSRFAAEVEAMNEEFLAEQRALTEELALLGQDQGRGYGEAVAEGLASQVPAVQAAAQALRDAMAGLEQARPPTSTGTLINTETGRPAFTGPSGEGGLAVATAADRAKYPGLTSWTMPDGRTAYYVPGHNVQAGNLGALRGYAVGTPFVPSDGPAFLHRGERVFSASDNSALVRAVQQIGGAPPVSVVAEVYVDGQRMVDDRIKVVLRENRTGVAIAGRR